MRICHVLDHSVPLFSGYAFRTLNILRQQRALGWTTCHLTGPKQGKISGLLEEVKGLSFYRTPEPGALIRTIPAADQIHAIYATARRLLEVVETERPNILHAHSPCLNGLAALYVGRRVGLPVVYEMRATWEDASVNLSGNREGGVRYTMSKALESTVLKRADAVVTICDGLRNEVLSRGIAAERVTVVPNAVDAEQFSIATGRDRELTDKLGIRECPTAGFIGSFYDYEGLDLLIEAAPRLFDLVPQARILLIGDGPVRADVMRKTEQAGLDGRVLFCGRVPHEDVARYYSLIDVLVYPRKSIRLTELTTPLKPLEAMAQGKVVLASNIGGHRELIDDGRTGYLFPTGNATSLADRLADLLSTGLPQSELRKRARRYVEHERTWQNSVLRYEAVYRRLVASPDTSQGRAI